MNNYTFILTIWLCLLSIDYIHSLLVIKRNNERVRKAFEHLDKKKLDRENK